MTKQLFPLTESGKPDLIGPQEQSRHNTAKKTKGIPSLTGIRGVGAVCVMLYHLACSFPKSSLFSLRYLPMAWHVVDLFFMLSGFVLMYAHERDFKSFHFGRIISFAKLRISRAYPLNTAVLLLISLLVIFQPGFVAWRRSTYPLDFSPSAFLETLFLSSRWFSLHGHGDWNIPVWSLSLEFIGYVFFPFIAYGVSRLDKVWQTVAIAAATVFGSLVLLGKGHMLFFNAMVGRFAFLRMLSCFLVGVVVFKTWQLSAKRMEKWAGALTLVASLGMLVAGFVWQVEVLMNVFLATLLYGLAFQKGPIAKLLASRVAVYLGTISFPLYVMHDVPLLWVQYFVSTHSPVCSTAQTLALVAAWVVGTVCLATVLHYTVEKPSHMWGRKWAGREVRTSREAVPALSSPVTAWDAQLASSGYRERSLPVATGRFTRMPATHNFQTSPHDTSMAR